MLGPLEPHEECRGGYGMHLQVKNSTASSYQRSLSAGLTERFFDLGIEASFL